MLSARFSLPRRGVYAQAVLPLVAVSDLLAGQFFPHRFRRFDLMIRARLVRAWASQSDDIPAAEEAYRLMQSARGATDTMPRFRALVESVQTTGMNPEFPVGVSPRGPLLDGAHRVAVALALEIPTIAVDVRNSALPQDYSRAWLAEAGLPGTALDHGDLLLDELLATTGHDTIVAVSGEMTDHIWKMVSPGATVVTTRDAALDANQAAALDRALSELPWHEHSKREQLAHQVITEGPVTIVRLRLPRPLFRRLDKTHTRISALADGYREQFLAAGVAGRVGLTGAQNRAAVSVLRLAGLRVWGDA
jgi:ParB-like chromosome segregation protein Spo0J